MTRRCALATVVLAVMTTAAVGCGPFRFFQRFRNDNQPPVTKDSDAPQNPAVPPREVDDSPLKPVQDMLPPRPVLSGPLLRPEPETIPLEPAVLPRRPQTILALSGGGSYGAFTAGVLNGWSRTSNRPEFDVVTGVSTGALISPLAFMGSAHDFEMKKYYTEVQQRDVFAMRFWATIPFRDAVATAAPLRRIVASQVTEEMVRDIAAEHKKGRRLYVATTHLEGRRSVVWDIGAIACKGGDARQLICDVLIASSAVPGIFPPVPIHVQVDGKEVTELHVDGGVTAPIFVPPAVLEEAGKGQNRATLYVIIAGKEFPEPSRVRPRVLKVLSASGGALLYSHARRDVSNLYHMAKLSGVAFRAVSLRPDYPLEESAIEFDQNAMNKLFVEGVKVGVAGPVWVTEPPDRGPGEPAEIRTGPRFRSAP
ncbi:patatin-like phospholipase family protein [Fimbriiglobus ruber]|uniref:Putative lipoprotein n=1 Tax=Fimbriiglobus ruber TaxID=1908690 RepID=A0A225DP49_9BACT|nr:patatin-like phospholipase family protein [Fimbriiglobus ruber]OWK43081.1 putative lipoprotein [Fimbriiglobus ruber]